MRMCKSSLEHRNGFVDLHLHLDGSISLESAKELARMQNIEIPVSDEEIVSLLSVRDGCKDLNEYLEKFDFPCSLLQTKKAITKAVYNLGNELWESGYIYAELRFAPQKHCEKGLTQEEAVQAALEGMRWWDFPSKLILCCMRGTDNIKENMETVRVASDYKERGVCGVDLAGAEALYKTKNFRDVFAYAKECGLHITIHAGEADGPESIYEALEMGAERIGHGVRCLEDAALIKQLVEKNIYLELCPTSNLNTAVFEEMSQYPIQEFLKKGVKITVNTDNLSVSNTTLRKEFIKLCQAGVLRKEDVHTILRNSAQASFAENTLKSLLQKAVDGMWENFSDSNA